MTGTSTVKIDHRDTELLGLIRAWPYLSTAMRESLAQVARAIAFDEPLPLAFRQTADDLRAVAGKLDAEGAG